MKLRVLDLLLLLLILCGGTMAWRTGRERSRLSVEYRRLTSKTGEITVADPARAYYSALKTGDPQRFAWRVYLPPNFKQILRHNAGGSSTSTSSSTREYVARVRFRENEAGGVDVFTSFSGGSTRMGLLPKPVAVLLHDRWDKLLVKQIGSAGATGLDPTTTTVLLELRMPPEIQEKAREVLTPYEFQQSVPSLFRMELGPEAWRP